MFAYWKLIVKKIEIAILVFQFQLLILLSTVFYLVQSLPVLDIALYPSIIIFNWDILLFHQVCALLEIHSLPKIDFERHGFFFVKAGKVGP
jgi:hypothetical protein